MQHLTDGDILDALRDALKDNTPPEREEGVFTKKEMIAALEMNVRSGGDALRRAVDDGRIEFVGRVPVMRIDRVRGLVPAYRIVEPTVE